MTASVSEIILERHLRFRTVEDDRHNPKLPINDLNYRAIIRLNGESHMAKPIDFRRLEYGIN